MLAALALAVVTAHAAQAPTAGPSKLPPDPAVPKHVLIEDPPIFPLGQIKAGMRGKGYTVFSSEKGPEPFEAVVLGVMRGFLGPGEDLIIARLEGKEIERTGVIAGMSGSPVYIDGKLVGAVGYRFGAFTKDPIAGITPIERMMTSASPAAPAPKRPSTTSAYGKAEPIAIPLAAAGMFPHVMEAFSPLLEQRGYGALVPGGHTGTSGGTGAAAAGTVGVSGDAAASAPTGAGGVKPVRFFAGGPISGNLIDGDLSIGAIGTVTWVKGDRFLAFGHPFLGNGESEMPVANAEIVTTVASEAGSWKMGQGTVAVGRLSDDRLHAIAGSMGDPPPMVPLVVKIDGQSPRERADAKKELHFRVFKHPTDTPLFVAIAVANTLASRVAAERSGGTVDVDIKARLSTGEIVPYTFRAADDGIGFELPVAFAVLGLLGTVVDQDFKKVEITDVQVNVASRTEVDRTRIVGVDVPRALVAGKTGEVRVRLQRYHGPITEQRVQVRIPRGIAPGTYQLVAAGQTESLRTEREGGLLAQATSFKGYLKNVLDQPAPGTLSLYLVRDDPSPRLDGTPLPDLPASLAGLISDGGGLSGGTIEARAVRLTRVVDDGVISGESIAKVQISDEE